MEFGRALGTKGLQLLSWARACGLSLMVHVPKYYILWPQSIYIGTTLRPKYILLFEYMDPQGLFDSE